MRDVDQRLTQQRQVGERLGVPFELRVAHKSADVHGVRCDLDRVETSDPVDVNEVAGRRKPHVENRDQTLTTCKHLGVIAYLGQDRHGFVHAARCVMNKGGGLHRSDPACSKGS